MDAEPKIKMGRRPKEINEIEFEKLCYIQATKQEIADWFGCHEDTVHAWTLRTYHESFSVAHKRLGAGGRISVRRKLIQMAEAGNLGALIFALKNYCGLTDHYRMTSEVKVSEIAPEMGKERLVSELNEILSTIEECKTTSLPQPSLPPRSSLQ